MKKLKGRADLYNRLVGSFFDEYAGTSETLEAHLSKREFPQAKIIVHSLKGLAGNIGADRLQEAAEVMERYLLAEEPDNYRTSLETFQRELSKVMAALASALESNKAESGRTLESEFDPIRLWEILDRLRPFLEAQRPKESRACLEELQDFSWPDDLNESIQHL
ncbi:MAG: Hpt domain-containing protein, partial [Proteobacteria bacterium]|nr:Hpt domain-containing protein [Pseudomonadota bacterium]